MDNFKDRRAARRNLLARAGKLLTLLLLLSLTGLQWQNTPVSATTPAVDPLGSVFGVEMTPIADSGGLAMVGATQTAWTRGVEVIWSDIEPNNPTGDPDPYDWTVPSFTGPITSTLSELGTAIGNGYEPIVVVRSTPTWAQQYLNTFCGRMTDGTMGAFGDFMAALVGHLNTIYTSQHVTYYEIWNEPDVQHAPSTNNFYLGCWGEPTETNFGGKHYADMLKQVTPKVHAADPNAKVLVGGLLLDCDPNNPPSGRTDGCIASKFIEGVLANATAGDFDGIAFHAYDYFNGSYAYVNSNWHSSSATTGPVTTAKTSYLRSLLAKYHMTGKPLLNTENALVCSDPNGCSNKPNHPDFEATKAAYVAETFGTAINQGLLVNIWYNVTGQWKDNGLVSVPGLNPLPAYDAYQFASQELKGVIPGGTLNRYAGVHGYTFRTTGNEIWLLWSADGQTHTIYLPASPLAIFDLNGNPQTIPPNTFLNIGLQPVYLEMPLVMTRLVIPSLAFSFYPFTNGNFEDGLSGWQAADHGLPVSLVSIHPPNPVGGGLDNSIPEGHHSLLLGKIAYPCKENTIPIGYAEAAQKISIPALPASQSSNLSFDYIIYSTDASPAVSPEKFDRFEVHILDGATDATQFADANTFNNTADCNQWRRVPSFANPRGGITSGWATATIDLSPYKGKTITVSFRNYNRFDGNFNTFTYLDNVRMVSVP